MSSVDGSRVDRNRVVTVGVMKDSLDSGTGNAGSDIGIAGPDVVISLCPDGPMLVRGTVTLVDTDGAELPRNRATIALCRCGRTASTPFCDGSHKLIQRPGTNRDAAGR